MSKTALILEGGAMRGIYTAGVLDTLWEKGFRPDGIFGVSAGAIHGLSFVSGQPGRSIRYYTKYSRDRRFFSLFSLLTTGSMVGEKFCYHDIPDRLDPFDYDAFSRSPIEFYAVSTSLTTGEGVYTKCEDLRKEMDWVRASASMPFVSRKVWIKGKPYLDGGVADSIPLQAARKLGYDKCVVVLTRCAGYRKKPQSTAPAKLLYGKYPAFVAAIAKRHQHYNQTVEEIEQLAEKQEIFLLRPSRDLHISRTEKDPERLMAQYNLGRSDMAAAPLDRWL